MLRTLILSALLAAAPLTSASADVKTAPGETTMAAPGRHADYAALLEKYVAEKTDGANRFDYAALRANPEDRARLDAYIASFAALDFDALSRDARFAAWANLYNAVTIRHIIERYPVGSIRDGYVFSGPWKEVKTVAGGREVSLDEIEHDILRKQWSDPRVHYAVNCASIGCPDLRAAAWEAETLDEDLDAAARAYVNAPRGVTIRSDGTLQVSRIYKWFREDFGGANAGVIEHLLKYADRDLAAQIRANPKITRHAYDWSLNDVER